MDQAFLRHFRPSSRGRVVKALDLKSNGVSPRRFESCRLRNNFFLFPFRNSDVPNRRASACGLDCPDYVNGSTWYRHKTYVPPKIHSNANKRYFSVSFQIKSKLQLSQGYIFFYRIRKRTSLQSQLNTISQFRGHQRGKICVISRSWSLKKKRKKSHPGMQINLNI